jgi:hydrogenase maturation protease
VAERRILVLCVGNAARGDDAAGPALAQALGADLPPGVELAICDGEAAAVLDKLAGVESALIVDACVSGAPAGHVHRFDVADAPLPHGALRLSSHGLGLHEALELARAMNQLPPACLVYAIEGEAFAVGTGLSKPVAQAVGRLAARLREDLAESLAPNAAAPERR